MQVWRRLGRFEEVEELDLGGEPSWKGIQCPMDKEELFLLLPEGEGALAGLRVLFLWWCANMVDYDFLRALASAGCGEKLTSLTLWCECLFLLLCLVFFLWAWVSSVLRLALSAWRRLLVVPLPLRALSLLPVSLFFPSLLTRGWNETQGCRRV